MRSLAVIGMMFASLPVSAGADNSAAAPPTGNFIGEIRYETTPGKPMELAKQGEPAERVTARREGARYVLAVARNVGKTFEEGRGTVTEAEWRALETLITKGVRLFELQLLHRHAGGQDCQ